MRTRVLLADMHGPRPLILLLLLVMGSASGCAHNLSRVGPLVHPSIEDKGPLNEAIQRYYTATTPDALRTAVTDALRLAPNDAMAHEIAAGLAHFEGDLERQVAHLLEALADE